MRIFSIIHNRCVQLQKAKPRGRW